MVKLFKNGRLLDCPEIFYPSVYDLQFLQQNMFVIHVAFGKEHKAMLAHCKNYWNIERYTSIHPKFNKLITSLSTAVENGEGVLDNEATSHNGVFDSVRLSLMFWHWIFFEEDKYDLTKKTLGSTKKGMS